MSSPTSWRPTLPGRPPLRSGVKVPQALTLREFRAWQIKLQIFKLSIWLIESLIFFKGLLHAYSMTSTAKHVKVSLTKSRSRGEVLGQANATLGPSCLVSLKSSLAFYLPTTTLGSSFKLIGRVCGHPWLSHWGRQATLQKPLGPFCSGMSRFGEGNAGEMLQLPFLSEQMTPLICGRTRRRRRRRRMARLANSYLTFLLQVNMVSSVRGGQLWRTGTRSGTPAPGERRARRDVTRACTARASACGDASLPRACLGPALTPPCVGCV